MTQTAADMVRQAMTQIESVTPQDAYDEIASDHVAFLDVREPVEWEDHITGAVQVPRGLLEFVADPASPKHNPELDPERRVIVYCRSGTRATLATLTLKTLGYEDVANLEGGFTAWKDAGLPTAEHHSGL